MICGTRRTAAGVGLPVLVASRDAPLQRIEAGAEQRLAHVDVAETRDDALIHQQRLEIELAAARLGRQEVRRQLVAERLDAETREKVMLGQAIRLGISVM